MNNSTEVLRVEKDGVELFTIVATGESGMSQRGLARACGKSHTAIQKLEKSVATKNAPKRLKRFSGKQLRLATDLPNNPIVYRADFCSAVIKHYAYLGSEAAQDIDEATGEIGLTSYIQGETGWLPEQYQASRDARQTVNRILLQNKPYAALYRKDMCEKAFEWFGCQFYWDYFYCWMTPQERCDLDNRNPVVKGQRKSRIHQWIEPETKERLREKAIELRALIVAARSRPHFIELFCNSYGDGWQMSIFD